MREYKIKLDNEIAVIYEEIAKICNKSIEEVLEDTLYKVIEITNRKIND